MDSFLGLLRIRVLKGINLAVRDTASATSDPYVVITFGNQKVRTKVVKDNCNPVWNEELTLYVKDPNLPLTLTVYDKDTFTADDKMGVAEFHLKQLLECVNQGLEGLENGTIVDRVQPGENNCLSHESCIFWNDGKLTQDMILRLRNVECGEVEIQIQWINLSGCK